MRERRDKQETKARKPEAFAHPPFPASLARHNANTPFQDAQKFRLARPQPMKAPEA